VKEITLLLGIPSLEQKLVQSTDNFKRSTKKTSTTDVNNKVSCIIYNLWNNTARWQTQYVQTTFPLYTQQCSSWDSEPKTSNCKPNTL